MVYAGFLFLVPFVLVQQLFHFFYDEAGHFYDAVFFSVAERLALGSVCSHFSVEGGDAHAAVLTDFFS